MSRRAGSGIFGKRLRRGEPDFYLQITSLIDTLVIILVFMLMTIGSGSVNLEMAPGVHLPWALAGAELTQGLKIVARVGRHHRGARRAARSARRRHGRPLGDDVGRRPQDRAALPEDGAPGGRQQESRREPRASSSKARCSSRPTRTLPSRPSARSCIRPRGRATTTSSSPS